MYVLEEKCWNGPIHGNDNGWVLSGGESRQSPLNSVASLCKYLAGTLRRDVPGMRRLSPQMRVVEGFVVISGQDVTIFVQDERVNSQVLMLADCHEELVRFDERLGKLGGLADYRDAIIERLVVIPGRPEIPSRIGAFEIVEQQSSLGPGRTFLARHESGDERILRLIEKPPLADADSDSETALTREYDALRRLEGTGRVQRVDPYFFWEDGQYWVFPLHPLRGRSLRASRLTSQPSSENAARVVRDAAQALAAVHVEGIYHRALSPDRIHLLPPDDSVAFSDFLIARITGEGTVVGMSSEIDPPDLYRDPDAADDSNAAASDVYGLAASLAYWVSGLEPEEGTPFGASPAVRDAVTNALGDGADVLLACLDHDKSKRPALDDLLAAFQPPQTSGTGGTAAGGEQWAEGVLVDGQYRILRLLPSGGTADACVVKDEYYDRYYVLKRVRDNTLVTKLAGAEFDSLLECHYPSLPRVYDVKRPGAPYHLKLQYIPGESLRELGATRQGDAQFVVRVASGVLGALQYVHERGMWHRDVSRGNVLVPESDDDPVYLIDFGLAAPEGAAESFVGTPNYRAPEIERGGSWSAKCDIYSASVVLFELLTGHLPYATAGVERHKDVPVQPTAEEVSSFGRALLDALLRGAAFDPAARPASAADLLDELTRAAAGGVQLPPGESGPRLVNPFVDELRQAYQNSVLGNAHNRGLDGAFARDTYVKTRLDESLLPAILAGRLHAVIFSGNPGDGKTAFLERLEEAILARGGEAVERDASGWLYALAGRRIGALYDASESHEGRSADELFHKVLAPLLAPDGDTYTAAIAANDGRLLDFGERNSLRYGELWEAIRSQVLASGEASSDDIAVIDLKRRSLVALDDGELDIADAMIEQFVRRDQWAVCEGCTARGDCSILFNVLSLREEPMRESARRGLRRLLLAAHLRREKRATIRDLRSALAYILTADIGCDDVHAEREKHLSPLDKSEWLYFNTAFTSGNASDLVLDEWAQMDPALVSSPRLDRFLFFHRHRDQAHVLQGLFAENEHRSLRRLDHRVGVVGEWLAEHKRRFYFEGRSVDADSAWDIPGRETLLPYRYFSEFRAGLEGGTSSACGRFSSRGSRAPTGCRPQSQRSASL